MAVMLPQNPVGRILENFRYCRTVTSSSSFLLAHNEFPSAVATAATTAAAARGATRGVIFFCDNAASKTAGRKNLCFIFGICKGWCGWRYVLERGV